MVGRSEELAASSDKSFSSGPVQAGNLMVDIRFIGVTREVVGVRGWGIGKHEALVIFMGEQATGAVLSQYGGPEARVSGADQPPVSALLTGGDDDDNEEEVMFVRPLGMPNMSMSRFRAATFFSAQGSRLNRGSFSAPDLAIESGSGFQFSASGGGGGKASHERVGLVAAVILAMPSRSK